MSPTTKNVLLAAAAVVVVYYAYGLYQATGSALPVQLSGAASSTTTSDS